MERSNHLKDVRGESRQERSLGMPRILIVFHSLSGNTKAAADAVAEGAREMPDVDVDLKSGLSAKPDDLLEADGVAFGTPDFFSYMAGGLKDFFDRCYYPTQDKVNDLPCGIFVTHGGGGSAAKSVVEMCRTFKFGMVGEPILIRNAPGPQEKDALKELGRKLATAGLSG